VEGVDPLFQTSNVEWGSFSLAIEPNTRLNNSFCGFFWVLGTRLRAKPEGDYQ